MSILVLEFPLRDTKNYFESFPIIFQVNKDGFFCLKTVGNSKSRVGGNGCAGCGAAHPIFGSFIMRDPSFKQKK